MKEVGAGVTEFAVGDLIAADTGLVESCSDPAPASGTAGAFAEFTCVPAKLAVKVPAGVDMDSAAGLPLAGLTAYQAIFSGCLPTKSVTGEPLGNLTSGQTILVIGGASSTGSYAVQLAKAAGATVLTTASANTRASGETKIDFVKAMGADEVCDYKTEDWAEKFKGRNVDLIFDTVGKAEDVAKAQGVLKAGSLYVTIANFTPETVEGVTVNLHPPQ